eukprot:TRINITY_DN6086_c0_g1_i2.p1 TRINITY_DN6086_c0_g1~~TRINITY_DN6086_c0_g1_i2.p1  ORF type:complete len:251 (-),score=45.42 TRINITY_DN6086_c0_g1_i2:19-771(-)
MTTKKLPDWTSHHGRFHTTRKKYKGGEDTYFVSKDGSSFGVFDGVGGWADRGVDPRQYSYQLSLGCIHAADKLWIHNPLAILITGYNYAKGVTGSSTAVVAVVSEGILNVANLGDSGFMVIRNGQVVLRSKEQQHRFNMPYQLGSNNRNKPTDADLYKFQLQEKDIIVLATDGVLDNLYDNQILDIVKQNQKKEAQVIAKMVAEKAYQISKDPRAMVPFNKALKLHEKTDLTGGKEDDITLIIAKYKYDE